MQTVLHAGKGFQGKGAKVIVQQKQVKVTDKWTERLLKEKVFENKLLNGINSFHTTNVI